jgi:hypothetical protein
MFQMGIHLQATLSQPKSPQSELPLSLNRLLRILFWTKIFGYGNEAKTSKENSSVKFEAVTMKICLLGCNAV